MRTARAVADGLRDATRAISASTGAWCAAIVLVALSDPRAVQAPVALAIAAVGLSLVAGDGGQPLPAQGALVGIGAALFAALRAQEAVPLPAALALAAVAGGIAGLALGRVLGRAPLVAVVGAGALLAWTCAIAFQRIDAVMGGAAGRVVVSSLSPRAVLLVSVALLVVAALATTALRRSAFGLRLRTVGASSAFAEAVGIDVSRARTGAHGFSGACAGVAGGLLVEGVGLADWTTYGVHLSFLLLAAVVVGGATSATGAAVGVALASLLSSASATVLAALGDAAAVDVAPPVADALLAITVLVAIGSRGLVPRFRRRPPTATGAELPAAIRASLGVTGLTVRFGDVLALDGLAFTAAPSSVTALVGANGAGKSTVLAAIAGALAPSAGTITIDPPAAGVARTLQDPQLPPAMTAFECVVAASDRVRRRGGVLRCLLSTPAARAEQRAVEGRAASLLALASLAALADVPVVEIAPGERGLLAAICAVATGASVLLLDEAAAGGGVVGRARFDGLVRTLRAGGRTVVLVEHDRRLVADLADVVVVVDPPPVGFGR